MTSYQKRILDEQKELSIKIKKLTDFVTDHTRAKDLREREFNLMRAQLESMLEYDRLLQMRLIDNSFKEAGS